MPCVYVLFDKLDENICRIETSSVYWDAHCAKAFLLVQVFHGNRPLDFDTLQPNQPVEQRTPRRVCYRLQMDWRKNMEKNDKKYKDGFIATIIDIVIDCLI